MLCLSLTFFIRILGQVELPPECADESTPQKQIFDSTKLHYYKVIFVHNFIIIILRLCIT